MYVAESKLPTGLPAQVSSPGDVCRIVREAVPETETREHLAVLYLNSRLAIIGGNPYIASIGLLDSCPVHPREVFGPALERKAAAIILVHNHPSGDPTPSSEDWKVTQRIAEAGEILGIPLLDHIVLGADGSYASMKGMSQK